MKILLTLLLLFAQTDLPEYGEITELKDNLKVYLATESPSSRKLIIKALDKKFTVVSSPDDAEFFLTYDVEASTESRGLQRSHYMRSRMLAYTLTEKGRKRILWSDDETWESRGGMTFTAPNEWNLAKNFIKALKKAKLIN